MPDTPRDKDSSSGSDHTAFSSLDSGELGAGSSDSASVASYASGQSTRRLIASTPKERSAKESELVAKLDRRILPLTCLLYLFAYLDRSNLGNARLQGLPEDVLGGDPTGQLFDGIVSAFFFTYILAQVPATVISKLYAPRAWIAGAAIGWGLSATLMSTANGFANLVVGRLFLGLFEAGFGPAIPLYFSFFYTKEEMGLRMAYWFGFAAVAGTFGGLVAYAVENAQTPIANWRLLFIIEGSPAIVMGIVTYFMLPDRPESTSFLDETERKSAIERVNRGTRADTGATLNRKHIIAALIDWRVYVAGLIFFGLNCALASISAFLPTILKTFGYTNQSAQLLTVPPYAAAAALLVSFCYISDRMQSRGVWMALGCSISCFGYLLLLTVERNSGVRYFATFCITGGTYSTIGLTITWFAHNLGSETKRATGIPIFVAIGQCGSILGSHIFPKTGGPKYTKGFTISCVLQFVAALCSFILTISYRRENARRDRLFGRPDPDAPVDTDELADQAPDFRYVV